MSRKLTRTKPRPSKPCMVCQFVKSDMSRAVQRVKRTITRTAVPYVSPAHYTVPDSQACQQALALVKQFSPEFLVNHSLRSYAFGLAMNHKIKQGVDKEVFFVGAILHDIGLTDYVAQQDTFEVEGAIAAQAFALEQGLSAEQADLIHEMVALHNSVGVAHQCDPEIALLHFGAGADVAGLWVEDIHKKTLHEVLDTYHDQGCQAGMIQLIQDQVTRKPHSYMSTMVDLGFLKKVAKHQFAHNPT
ncbi:HD domain-containing protein [Salinivibrio sp. PR6]|uniref:HD domain-containing protein n=1 Tax=Salinivibrio sp. PR6 TaxID=1909485 RepID=UPI0018E9D0E1|nr:HD domain-containing protein [Salinivibrio sp. PR6]